jgi:hypothetical protein
MMTHVGRFLMRFLQKIRPAAGFGNITTCAVKYALNEWFYAIYIYNQMCNFLVRLECWKARLFFAHYNSEASGVFSKENPFIALDQWRPGLIRRLIFQSD